MNIMKTLLFSTAFLSLSIASNAGVPEVKWDSQSLIIDGKRVVPVMGEIHYSRIPADEWKGEIAKMKEGGVTMIATYVFWNHIEEIENQFDWSGQRNLRHFLEVCKDEKMPVILRLGPFCHGEVRNGGIPDWVLKRSVHSEEAGPKPMKVRSEDPRFLALVDTLYRQIFTQVQGLQWKDGGPVVACQFDNEYRGHGSYLMALKKIANRIGFDLPFYTRTGWPDLVTPVPYGELLPLYGDYADGFWERSLKPTAGNYYKAFFFKPNRDSKSIATEQITYSKRSDSVSFHAEKAGKGLYPYFTCELGGGMMTAYHRRPYMYPNDAYAMAVVKLGSGSNLLGYYMYHGGTNPDGKKNYLNENQRTQATNYNDMPVKTYDFQAPLGEFGQKSETYYCLRPLHLFMKDFAEVLAPMEAHFPQDSSSLTEENTGDKSQFRELEKGDDTYLRWSYRMNPATASDRKHREAFIFFNNYERLQTLSPKTCQFSVAGVKLPEITIPSNTMGIFPVNVAGIRYATAQLVASREGKIYLMQIPGIKADMVFSDGKVLKNIKPRGLRKPIYKNYYLLDEKEAEHLFLPDEAVESTTPLIYNKVKEAGPLRQITIGRNKVAEEPSDSDFNEAAVYQINIPANSKGLLDITYQGDCARLYDNGKLLDDNFYNGRHFQYGLWRLPAETTKLELRILPMQRDEPVYFPGEADTTPGEKVIKIEIKTRKDSKL